MLQHTDNILKTKEMFEMVKSSEKNRIATKILPNIGKMCWNSQLSSIKLPFSFNNPLTPKIWLLILLSSYYTFPCTLVKRSWSYIKITPSGWWVCRFSSPFCWTMYWYYAQRLHVNHVWELKGYFLIFKLWSLRHRAHMFRYLFTCSIVTSTREPAC